MLKKLVIFFVFFSFIEFSVWAAPFNQNFYNNSFSPIVIPGVVSNTSVGFYLDFFNPFTSNTSFEVYIGGDNYLFSKSFNFSRNITLKPYEHFRLNTTISPEGVLNSEDYFLVVRSSNALNATSNFTVLDYLLFENQNPSNFFYSDYTPVVVQNSNDLNIFVDFFNPYNNASNFSIIVSNVGGSNAFQEQSFNFSLKFLQHAKFSVSLTPLSIQSSVMGQNSEVWVRVYDLSHETLVLRTLLSFSSLALPPSQQKSVSSVVQESFSLWVLILVVVLVFLFFLFSVWDYYSGLGSVRKIVGRAVVGVSGFFKRLRKACGLAARDFLTINAVYKIFKVLLVLIVFLLLLQSLNVVQVFSLYYLLALVFVLGVFLAVEKK
jgi:hypothetical protein